VLKRHVKIFSGTEEQRGAREKKRKKKEKKKKEDERMNDLSLKNHLK
jgi:hypothetical protein